MELRLSCFPTPSSVWEKPTFVTNGNPEPFFKIVEDVLQENHSNRDEMVYGEKHLQTLYSKHFLKDLTLKTQIIRLFNEQAYLRPVFRNESMNW